MDAPFDLSLRLLTASGSEPRGPFAVGVPLPKGILKAGETLGVEDDSGQRRAIQARILETWPSGDPRWILLEGWANPGDPTQLRIRKAAAATAESMARSLADGSQSIDTGSALFHLPVGCLQPIASIHVPANSPSRIGESDLCLEDAEGVAHRGDFDRWEIEASGPLRTTLVARGSFRAQAATADPLCRFLARLTFFRASSSVRCDITLHNPRPASHPGGVWDLGDPGSIRIRSLVWTLRCPDPSDREIAWRLETGAAWRTASRLEIDQASSGGPNWDSRAHLDCAGRVPLPFAGCRVRVDGREESVARPHPVVRHGAEPNALRAAIPNFWQSFPHSLEADAETLRIGFFPTQQPATVELQGGEKTTRTVWISLDEHEDLGWVFDPVVPVLPTDHYASTSATALFSAEPPPESPFRALVAHGVEGTDSFAAKREVIDEYGWRNFGDVWADHEQAYFEGPKPIISHYNNQYDMILGFLAQFARTSDPRWFPLARDLARHVIDIDIYHTENDKPSIAGGMFWHTVHYQDAERSSHRSYTADCPEAARARRYGGGPSNEHNYTTGLLHFFLMTGDPDARTTVIQLADWVRRMDDGSQSLLAGLAPGPTGWASRTREDGFHGPGRGAGNSILALLDAFRLTSDRTYVDAAETILQRCIHPRDDIEGMKLHDIERRWSYVVFLQALGRYLDFKDERDETDAAFCYARDALLHYAEWMVDRETPIASRFDEVDFPTESWPAQDIRKSSVFAYAAYYGSSTQRARFSERAEFFYRQSLESLSGFDSCTHTRPMAVLMANGSQYPALLERPLRESAGPPSPAWPDPVRFVPQRERARAAVRTPAGLARLLGTLLRRSTWKRLYRRELW